MGMNMKKWLSAMLIGTMLIALIGCGNSTVNEGTAGGDDQQPVEQEEETGSVEESQQPEGSEAEGLSGELNIWSSGEELGRFVSGFNQVYPDIKVNITVIPNADFLAKLTPVMSSGQGAPDIFTGESDYVKYLVESPFWEDLRGEPYNIEQYTDGIWPYVVSVGTDSAGAIKALSWQASPGSVLYRRDLAQQVFGTSDPEAVGALLASNDKMLEAAATLKENGIAMFASWQDILNMQFSNRQTAWVEEDKLIIDESMLDFMDMAKTIYESGYDLNVDPWSPEWSAAVESDNTFCYVLPSWGYQFVVKPAANVTMGQWGLAQGPVPYVKGGTWFGIYKDSPQKEAAWKFMEYVALNAEAQQSYAVEYGEYVSLKEADQALAAAEGEEVLGGQNLFEFYNDQMGKIESDLMTPYDGQINNAFLAAVKVYANGTMDKDAALAQFKNDVATQYPDLIIE
ncbi:MAG: ABC transporter substrate-binding protein [Lachnospiraceae bacterium]|jgi:ABC-type glycerol-3-phosphate transport system substrate-binding protein|nr:ABC transporter substrate-binding protein [Lachnospiraceae bacterium]